MSLSDNTLFLHGYGLNISVSYGRLKIRHGFPNTGETEELLLHRGTNNINHILVFGQSGAITFEAVNWLAAQNAMVTFFDGFGNVISEITPKNEIPVATKHMQACLTKEQKLTLGTWIISEKVNGQAQTLQIISEEYADFDWMDERRKKNICNAIEFMLHAVNNNNSQNMRGEVDLLDIESKSAQMYWNSFNGIPIHWRKTKNIPENWLCLSKRKNAKSGYAYNAVDPFNASLNYLNAVVCAKLKIMCIKNNLDVDFGIFHNSDAYKAGLLYDLIELLRAKTELLLFNCFMNSIFEFKDFYETPDGACKLSKNVICKLVSMVDELEIEIADTVYEFKLRLNGATVISKSICKVCQKTFIPKKKTQKYCCPEHRVSC
jgi:CRISPR-associated protein Cas1